MSKKLRYSNAKQRTLIVGRTGSGKTQGAVFQLSIQNFDVMPWIIFDSKQDDLINDIVGAQHVELGFIPTRPGIYICHPLPSEQEEMNQYLWDIWNAENIGVYIDEGYMIQIPDGLIACLTQGRSKRIPMILLSQRPAWITRFAFSESDFFQVFHLNDKRDRKTVEAFLPPGTDKRLPDYHSYFYDVGNDSLHRLRPVPQAGALLQTINSRLFALAERLGPEVRTI